VDKEELSKTVGQKKNIVNEIKLIVKIIKSRQGRNKQDKMVNNSNIV